MWPSEIFFINKWPLNANHKTDKTLFKELYRENNLILY